MTHLLAGVQFADDVDRFGQHGEPFLRRGPALPGQ
jgi:hypothetical protein